MTEKGNYVTVYRKQADGGWKIMEDINTFDSLPVPCPGQKARARRGKAKKKSGTESKPTRQELIAALHDGSFNGY